MPGCEIQIGLVLIRQTTPIELPRRSRGQLPPRPVGAEVAPAPVARCGIQSPEQALNSSGDPHLSFRTAFDSFDCGSGLLLHPKRSPEGHHFRLPHPARTIEP